MRSNAVCQRMRAIHLCVSARHICVRMYIRMMTDASASTHLCVPARHMYVLSIACMPMTDTGAGGRRRLVQSRPATRGGCVTGSDLAWCLAPQWDGVCVCMCMCICICICICMYIYIYIYIYIYLVKKQRLGSFIGVFGYVGKTSVKRPRNVWNTFKNVWKTSVKRRETLEKT